MRVERTIKELLDDVKKMVAYGVLIPDYEVVSDSYICFIVRNENGRHMYHCGKLTIYPPELQQSFLGLYVNETFGHYKITGVYKMAQELR